ncbi:hypothetical protein [Deinococcus soli (ex Cha et al. 2016)]|uniref:Uncharacterized protein n=2 Tax=Deinococcus soli (ex Cha et al. 2016) TaxID=1309411 RepID=A0AAE4BMD1_9DEIO|nr:hypothetical protein [Deinococcus soli (ex Cha et al. 2016)]MDR6218930.1 hypothetical protein [Deinococcus soli (ex Cha et al. 2016)]MDR6328727.1 hypothetical protein [Deinococcus soli (ex Cha et al. 2016)]MDR6751786.1 hypothetical protein [Deinococcus soli (ex Cha et al. 2016)]
MAFDAVLAQVKVASNSLPDGRPQSVMVLATLLLRTNGDFDEAYEIALKGPEHVRTFIHCGDTELNWLNISNDELHRTLSHIVVTAREYYRVADHPFKKFPPTPADSKHSRR